jgi:uncharacterized coiled-coil DUF342 family protein
LNKLEPEEKKKLTQQLDDTKKNIKQLRDSLTLINNQKEEWFQKKEAIDKQILALIGEAKTAKQQRNAFTSTVREAKGERQDFITSIKEKRILLAGLRKEKDELVKKLNIKKDPNSLKSDMEKLEYKLETIPMSFDKEQKLMKTIKDLRKKYKEVKGISSVFDKIRTTNKEIRDLKKRAEDRHRRVQDAAKHSQVHHESVVETSRSIDELKARQEEAYKKFLGYKEQFNEANDKLKEQLPALNEINQKLTGHQAEKKRQRRKKIAEQLRSKEETVQEKIKRGDKLTTEDLLIIQRTEQQG